MDNKEVLLLIFTVALVVLLLIFIYLSILIVRKRALKSVRNKTVGLISMYDELLEEKSNMLKDMGDADSISNDSNNCMEKQNNDDFSKTIINTANNAQVDYRSTNAMDLYKLIKTNFDKEPVEVINSLGLKVKKSNNAKLVFDELSFDNVYALSTLPKEEQLNILRSLKKDEINDEIDKFLSINKVFDIIKFYDFIKDQIYYEDNEIKLRVPSNFDKNIRGVKLIVDEDICEGFQVENGASLYDFSIQKRDVN